MNYILVYNSSTGVLKSLKPLFSMEEYGLIEVKSFQEMKWQVRTENVRLLITDIELTDGDGIEAIRQIRSCSAIPVIVLSKNDSEWMKVEALNAGADDYVVYPCNPLELIARIKSQLRRYLQLSNISENLENIYQVDGLVIDDVSRKVFVDDKEVRLTPIEYKILKLLVLEKGKVLSVEEIYESIWHLRAVGADNTIAVHIRHIREKIEANPKEPKYVKVVWGTGYKVG